MRSLCRTTSGLGERSTLAEIGKRLGRAALQQVACVAKPVLAWYRRLIARKFDSASPENSGWGSDRIVGALANLGHTVSDQTVGNILRRYGIQPPPRRSQNTTWKDFIASHMAARPQVGMAPILPAGVPVPPDSRAIRPAATVVQQSVD